MTTPHQGPGEPTEHDIQNAMKYWSAEGAKILAAALATERKRRAEDDEATKALGRSFDAMRERAAALKAVLGYANAVAELAERYTGKESKDGTLFELCVAVKAWRDHVGGR